MSIKSCGPAVVPSIALTAVGWIALLLYILGCRPSWSPDGSKLLFSYYDPDTEEAGVALFDRATGATRKIFIRTNATSDGGIIQVQWDIDGAHAILQTEEETILHLPIDPYEPSRELQLPDAVEWAIFPVPQIGENLYLTGETVVTRVDLETGKVKSRDTDRKFALYAGQERILYLAKTDDKYEVGEVDKEALTFDPLFELAHDHLARLGIDELNGYVAIDPLGRRLALTASSAHGTRIVLCNESGIERILTPRLPVEPYVLGNIEWSRARGALYAAAFTPSGLEDVTQISIAEIPLDTARARLIPLGQMQKDLPEQDEGWILQVALSPDESAIAASTAGWDETQIEAADRALFIVDLGDPERPVTKVPMPLRER